ncbi:myo-inositol 2-dehydrogenase/D-chiro-inositol 1-dehydrogenase [Jatrophihabitans sp. GAS493]|uniref:Gfo/Idh/MocA family oxidoreductase n=1 Tax=Jatrophihabitans sp. GAS493 TaxID=1907575 RepID=UPI000BB733CB|nr:Gfo/Idh/MocA family oxidoreductase [Jatrophihabitans sp. GAS493]SOD73853.1 myo-inositol 2-dehydrogenase/D-chiro-inositol 1-dehydrogenase [Jatrophihabitans sp. GAS493]
MTTSEAIARPVRVGLVGAGRIGNSHAEVLARRVPGAQLVAVADPRGDAAQRLAGEFGARALSPAELFDDPEVEAVVIAASVDAHVTLTEAATAAGKAVFCEKPMGLTLAEIDRSISVAHAAGVALQVGFNRRFSRDFAEAHRLIADGAIGTPQLLRSLTRDPGLANPAGVPPWTVFLQTLIHDFDTLLWLNQPARPVSIYAVADALVAPEYKAAGLLDTAVVVITFDNGAIATAEANFSASYGYDVRAEVFGSGGMITAGDGRRSATVLYDRAGQHVETARSDVELFIDGYTAEFVEFVDAVREKRSPSVTGVDARRALEVALGCIESVQTGAPVRLTEQTR